MQDFQRYLKPCAIGLCVLYIIFILFLPFVVLKGSSGYGGVNFSIDLKFGNLMSGEYDVMGIKVQSDEAKSLWVLLPLICGIGMAAACAVLPGKKAALICVVGAAVALITFWIVRGDLTDGQSGASEYFKIGSGPILALIIGLVAAVASWMSDSAPQRDTTPGVGRGNGNEW